MTMLPPSFSTSFVTSSCNSRRTPDSGFPDASVKFCSSFVIRALLTFTLVLPPPLAFALAGETAPEPLASFKDRVEIPRVPSGSMSMERRSISSPAVRPLRSISSIATEMRSATVWAKPLSMACWAICSSNFWVSTPSSIVSPLMGSVVSTSMEESTSSLVASV